VRSVPAQPDLVELEEEEEENVDELPSMETLFTEMCNVSKKEKSISFCHETCMNQAELIDSL
jgi:hypothetical protein